MVIDSIRQWRSSLLRAAIAIALLASYTGNAQTTSGTIVGTITDSSGSVIPQTAVTLTNVATSATYRAETDDTGFYQFLHIPPANYNVTVQKQGFLRLNQGPYKLEVEGSLRIDLRLKVGNVTETITVTAETPLVQAETTSLGAVIDERQTIELPLNGRNPMNLTALVPSVVPQGQSGTNPNAVNPFAWANYQIGGGMANQSATFIDGAPVNTSYANLTSLVPSQDSLAEFKVDTNSLPAEYGHLAGGAIQFGTKSGTNNLHGSLWEFIRNKELNANNWFDNHKGIPRPAFTQNQFGANVGGPVVIPGVYNGKDKTFFFFNFEGFYLRKGQTYPETVPTEAELEGNMNALPKVLDPATQQLVEPTIYDPLTTCTNPAGCAGDPTKGANYGDRLPFPGNIIPSDRINQVAVNYIKKFYPVSAVGTNSSPNNYTAVVPIGGQNFQTVAKIDHQVSEKQHISSRFTWWKNTNLPQDPFGTGICQDRCGEVFKDYNWVFADTYAFNPTTLLDMRVSYLRFEYTRTPKLTTYQPSDIGQTLGNGAVSQFPAPTMVSILGFDTFGTFASSGAGSTIRDYSDDDRIAGTFTKLLNKHTLKFGGEYRRSTFNFLQNNTPAGSFGVNKTFTVNNAASPTQVSGAGLATFLLGNVTSGSYRIVAPIASALHYPALFVTDDWRIASKLTLHFGLRWEDNLPWTERGNNISYFDPNQVNPILDAAGLTTKGSTELVASSTRSQRSPINSFHKQFSPRFGFSYAMGPNTVLSAGYGILWIPIDAALLSSPAWDSINAASTSVVATADGGNTPTASNNFANLLPGGVVQPPQRSTNPTTGFQYSILGNYPVDNIPNNPYPYAQQWNFGIQQQLGRTSVLSVAYAGAKGTHLPLYLLNEDALPDKYFNPAGKAFLQSYAANPLFGVASPSSLLGPYPYLPNQYLAVPYPQYAGVYATNANFGDSTYHSLQVKAQKRFSHGASIGVAYTFAKLISSTDTLTPWLEGSVADAYGSVTDPNNLALDKSISSNDVKHRLVINYVYDIPVGRGKAVLGNASGLANAIVGGWGLEGITTFQSGFPVAMSAPVNLNASVFGFGQRPDIVPGCDRTKQTGGPIETRTFFNTACFTQAPIFTFGESRNDPVVRAPGINNWDASIFKNFAIGKDGRTSVQFRAEFFNAWNRTQFGIPSGAIGTATAGTVSYQANEPRLIQFALRIKY
jgi:Carboxypeptidase regulatory-like domain